jgi:hypothetical protein
LIAAAGVVLLVAAVYGGLWLIVGVLAIIEKIERERR